MGGNLMARGTDCWHVARETRGFGALRAAEPPCFAVGVLARGSRSGRRSGGAFHWIGGAFPRKRAKCAPREHRPERSDGPGPRKGRRSTPPAPTSLYFPAAPRCTSIPCPPRSTLRC